METTVEKSWWEKVWPYFLTGVIVTMIILAVLGFTAYAAAGSIPLGIGKVIQNKMRKKVGLPKKKVKVIAPGRGIGNKKRREN